MSLNGVTVTRVGLQRRGLSCTSAGLLLGSLPAGQPRSPDRSPLGTVACTQLSPHAGTLRTEEHQHALTSYRHCDHLRETRHTRGATYGHNDDPASQSLGLRVPDLQPHGPGPLSGAATQVFAPQEGQSPGPPPTGDLRGAGRSKAPSSQEPPQASPQVSFLPSLSLREQTRGICGSRGRLLGLHNLPPG